ncbi:MAG TPA: hypothetical protein VE131_01525, partial [Terriglobales bacterium]|nr:hypothetical protein [Terriglobales bacterium]
KLMATGQGIAGRPGTVAKFLQAQLAESRVNYLLGQFAFGDLSLGESLQSLDLFVTEVAPDLE